MSKADLDEYDITGKGVWLAVRFLIKHPRLFIWTIPELLKAGLNDYLVAIVVFAHVEKEQQD